MNATCENCDTTFRGVDRDEDGEPYIEAYQCAKPGCEVYLCTAGCENLSFACSGCGHRFCQEHGVTLDEERYCAPCASAAVESQEPDCECRQTDVDLFDPAGCEFHDPNSPWNVRRRQVGIVQLMDEYQPRVA